MGRAGVLCGVVAMFGLTAAKCTPEERMNVVLDYARSHTEADALPAPTITVVADCEAFTVHAEGWPDDAVIMIGLESEPGLALSPVGGVVDHVWPVWDAYGSYYWSVGGLMYQATDPTVSLSDTVDCGAGQFG